MGISTMPCHPGIDSSVLEANSVLHITCFSVESARTLFHPPQDLSPSGFPPVAFPVAAHSCLCHAAD